MQYHRTNKINSSIITIPISIAIVITPILIVSIIGINSISIAMVITLILINSISIAMVITLIITVIIII